MSVYSTVIYTITIRGLVIILGRVVDGGMVGLLVYSTVSWTLIPHHHMLVVGRINGFWRLMLDTGTFSCNLAGRPSGTDTIGGAY